MEFLRRREMQRRRRDRLWLGILLALTYVLSAAWSLVTTSPVDGANTRIFPDEINHADVARYLTAHGTLPPYTMMYATSVHPPLYHFLVAFFLFVVAPMVGIYRALIVARLVTVFCSVGVVYLTYRAACHFGSRRLALTAAALVALIPTRVLIGGGITNENLAALGAAGTLAVLVGGMRRHEGFTPRALSLLALYLVVGIGSKVTCLGLLPAAMAAILWKAWRQGKPWAVALRPALALPFVVAAAWGWWFARNQQLYGDLFRKAAADQIWNVPQPGYAYYHAHRGFTPFIYVRWIIHSGWDSFWGNFSGVELPTPLYIAFALFQIVAIYGLLRLLRPLTRFGVGASLQRVLKSSRGAAGLIALGYVASVAVIFFAYNWSHYSSQGRYFFVTLLPFGIVTTLGWRAALRSLPTPWFALLTISFLIMMGFVDVYCLFTMQERNPIS